MHFILNLLNILHHHLNSISLRNHRHKDRIFVRRVVCVQILGANGAGEYPYCFMWRISWSRASFAAYFNPYRPRLTLQYTKPSGAIMFVMLYLSRMSFKK